jgi:arylsulfatase A-like enzyme
MALTLKLNGYSTAMFGKCHEVPVWESSPMGPFEHWPAGGGGFEYFYGFIGGENISGIRRCMRAKLRSSRRQLLKKDTT